MGKFLNPGATMLRRARASSIYVDKSGVIAYLNKVMNTEREYVCVSRPRRFGKSMAANMISAYYDRTVDGATEFAGLAIASDPSFDEKRNRFDVVKVNVQEFLSATDSVDALLARLQRFCCMSLAQEYPDVALFDPENLPQVMSDVFYATGRQFVIVIDEWDCVMRETASDHDGQRRYLDFLRAWLKDQPYVALAYMTGILPVKKCGTHSALNMFDEFSMVEPLEMAPYMGFTEAEVDGLCEQWGRDLSECRAWYDGYLLPGVGSVYAPRSVVLAMETGRFSSYWTRTETFEALKRYIDMDFDGLHDKVVRLVGGLRVPVNTETYGNDMTTFGCADDVLTLLIHLGYLAYDVERGEAFVPNREVAGEYANAIRAGGWDEVARALAQSERLADALVAGDAAAVAQGVQQAHEDAASVLEYNDENSLACALRLAFYSAIRRYRLVREMPAGKGFADLVMIPLASSGNLPGIVVELKRDVSPSVAIEQIRERGYQRALDGLADHGLILAGITYDSQSKEHACVIEHMGE